MLTEIAYSAVNQGAMPFWEHRHPNSLFHDADNLGQFFGNAQNPGDFPSALLTSGIHGFLSVTGKYSGRICRVPRRILVRQVSPTTRMA